jgi:hypothetical protein
VSTATRHAAPRVVRKNAGPYDSWSDEELLEHRLAARREIGVQKRWGDRNTVVAVRILNERVEAYSRALRERGFDDSD